MSQVRPTIRRSFPALSLVSSSDWPAPDHKLTVTVPLYAKKSAIWKMILAERKKRHAGGKTDKLIFLACHWAMIDFVTGANKERFGQKALVRAVQKLMVARKEWLDCGGAIAVPHINTLTGRCRDWLIWRASKTDQELSAVKRPKVRQALMNIRYAFVDDIWKTRYCEIEMPNTLRMMGFSDDHIKWYNIQVRITKLVRNLPFIYKNQKRPKNTT